MGNLLKQLLFVIIFGVVVIFGINQGLKYFFSNQIQEKVKRNDGIGQAQFADYEKQAQDLSALPVFDVQAEMKKELNPELLKRLKVGIAPEKIPTPECDSLRFAWGEIMVADPNVDSVVGTLMEQLTASEPNWVEIQRNLELLTTRTSNEWVKEITAETYLSLSSLPKFREWEIQCNPSIHLNADRLVLEAFSKFVFDITHQLEPQAFSEAMLVSKLFFRSSEESLFDSGLFFFQNVAKFLKSRSITNEVFTVENAEKIRQFRITTGLYVNWVAHSEPFISKVFSTLQPSLAICNLISIQLQADTALFEVGSFKRNRFDAILGSYKKMLDRCIDSQAVTLLNAKLDFKNSQAQLKLTESLKRKLFGEVLLLQLQLNQLKLDRQLHPEAAQN